MTATILVTGATGNVGREVVSGLEAAGVPFRVGAFNREAARKQFDSNTDIVEFDFLKPTTFANAFAGVEKLFLVRPPTLSNVQRDIAPALYAAIGAGVKHVVFLSLQGVEQNRVTPHYKIEQLLLQSGLVTTFLRASFFMQNLTTTHREEIRDRDEIAVPVGRAKTTFIDVRDIAAVAVRALTEPGHEHQRYTLTGSEALDYYEVAARLSTELGRQIRYTNPNLFSFLRQQIAAGRAPGFALVMAALYTITRFGNASTLTNDVQTLLGRAPITLAQFAADYRDKWMPDPPRPAQWAGA